MNTKNNQRTRITKLLLKNAMMDLLKEKGTPERISVKELCEKAEINRSTFYSHFDQPMDVYTEIENDLLEATADHLIQIGKGNNVSAHKLILSFLEFIKENDKQFKTLFLETNTGFRTKFLQQSIVQILDKFDIELDKEIEQYVFSYVLNGSSGIIVQWIRANYSADENVIVELLFKLNESALRDF